MPNITDGVVFGMCILVLDFLVWRLVRKDIAQLRFFLRTTLFAGLSYVLFRTGLSPFSPVPQSGDPIRHLFGQVLELTWWLQCAQLVTVVLDRVILPSAWHRERLFQDVLAALVFVAAALAATAYVLVLPVRGLLATSGAVAIVLGLAIQNTLNDVFSGVVLNATEPFRLGDSVKIGDVEGQVVGSNWRATRLLNGEGNIVVIPNSVAAKAYVVNNSEPPHMHGVSVSVEIGPEVRPAVVLESLSDAAAGVADILPVPRATVSVKHFGPESVEYEIVCYVDTLEKKVAARNALFDLAYRHLCAHDVQLRSLIPANAAGKALPWRDRLLRSMAIFETLNERELETLSASLTRHDYDAGQIVYKSGDGDSSLHIVGRGTAKVLLPKGEDNVELRRMGPGDSIGQSGILVGLAFSVTVVAQTKMVVFNLSKEVLTPIINERPEIAHRMCRLLTEHHALEESVLAEPANPAAGPQGLLQWIYERVKQFRGLVA